MLVNGVGVQYRAGDRAIRGAQAQVVDFDDARNNDCLAVTQFTVTEGQHNRRPDVVLFVNGLPLGIIELKNPTDEDATVWTAWQQLQTYKAELPALFSMNGALFVSDGTQARIGSLTAGKEWFKPWRTISGEALAEAHLTELEVMLRGVCLPQRFLALVRDFTVFEDDGSGALGQEDGWVPPVPRSTERGAGDATGCPVAAGVHRDGRGSRGVRDRAQAGW